MGDRPMKHKIDRLVEVYIQLEEISPGYVYKTMMAVPVARSNEFGAKLLTKNPRLLAKVSKIMGRAKPGYKKYTDMTRKQIIPGILGKNQNILKSLGIIK